MKKKRTKFKKLIPILIGLELMCQTAQAQTTYIGVISAINTLRASIDSLVATAATYIFQTPFNIGAEVLTNYTRNSAVQTIAPNITTLNNKDIQSGLSPDVANPNKNLSQLTSIQASDTVLPSATLGGLPVPFYSSAVQQNMKSALEQGDNNFNFQSLMAPSNLAYSTKDLQNYALNYIHFLSGYATPVSNINLNSYSESQLSTKQKLAIQNSANYQAYMVQRRGFLSQQSASLTSLYTIYQKRLPITTIKASDTPLGTDSPSLAQIEQYNATWRTASPTWYTQMATASQTNVEREILFILAELQVQLHQLHVDNEKMLALTSVGQAGALQTGKQTLAITERQVQDTINQQLRQNAQRGTTATTTTPTTQQSTGAQGQKGELKQAVEQEKAVQQQNKEQVGNQSQ